MAEDGPLQNARNDDSNGVIQTYSLNFDDLLF